MIRRTALSAVAVSALLSVAAWAAPGAKVLNPKGAEASALVVEVMKRYGIEQGQLAFIDTGAWTFGSEASAIVAMETTERATAVLEYGETPQYGKRLEDPELHYIHVFYLKDLAPGVTWHACMTCTDRNGRRVVSADVTVATKKVEGAVRIPDDLQGPPYVLDKPGTYYLVTKDITAPKTAFNIAAPGVTLDMGGHTVVYNEERLGLPTDSYNNMLKDSSFGVRVRGGPGAVIQDVKILNGTIVQGKGNDEGSYTTIGFNPIYFSGGADSEIAGVTCVYSGTQITGIMCHNPGENIRLHHCVVEDRGNLIANRHQQCAAIKFASPGGGKLYNNLVKRARQGALASVGQNTEVAHNEVHIDSHSINSFGIGPKDGCDVHHNRIFGCGDNVVAISTTGGCDKVKVHDNYIWLQAHDIAAYKQDLNTKDMESSEYSIMSGVRETWGSKDVDYSKNVILVTAREGGKVRGTFFFADQQSAGVVFRDNLVIALCEDDRSDGLGAIGGVGTGGRGAVIPIDFTGNTIVSNVANFNLQDSYGSSNNYRFAGNTFVKVGDRKDYRTIRSRAGYPSKGHVFTDTVFEGGAGFDSSSARGVDGFEVRWTLTLTGPAGADVSIKDAEGNAAFAGKLGDDGKLAVPLAQFKQAGGKRVDATPHAVTVTKDGKTATKTVTMDGKKEIRITP